MSTSVFSHTATRPRIKSEWLSTIDAIVAEHGDKLLHRKSIYEEAGQLLYADHNGGNRPNPWLHCAGWAVGDIGGGVLYLSRIKPYYADWMQFLIQQKIQWLKTVNREIWVLWLPGNLVMQSGSPPEQHPLWDELTPEWQLAAQVTWTEGANSYNGCAAHSFAEQTAIERVSALGIAGPHYFGPHTYDPLGWLHIKLGQSRILDWHAPLQLPGFALRDRPRHYRDWRLLRDRVEYVTGTCCTSCSNNVSIKGSPSVCCDQKPRNWDGIIDRHMDSLLREPVSTRKRYLEHPRIRAYRDVIGSGHVEGELDSPFIARYLRDLPWYAPDLSKIEEKIIRREGKHFNRLPIDHRAAIQFAKDFMPNGTWYQILELALKKKLGRASTDKTAGSFF